MYYFIINPVAGTGNVADLQQKIVQLIRNLGLEAEYAKTISPGDAAHLARLAVKNGYKRIVVVGGDGTVHEVLNGIAGSKIILGIIPCGKRNLIAGGLNIPVDLEQACLSLAKHRVEVVDVGQVGDRYFLSHAGIGLETELLVQNPRSVKKFWLNFSTSIDLQPFFVNMLLDNQVLLNTKTISISVVNLNHFFKSSVPQLKINASDGCFNLLVLSDRPGSGLVKDLYKQKVVANTEVVSFLKAKNIQILTPTNLPICADGEIMRRTTPIEFTLAPFKQKMVAGALR